MRYQFKSRPEIYSQLSTRAQLALSLSALSSPVVAWTPESNVPGVPGTACLSLCAKGQLWIQAKCVAAECNLSFAWMQQAHIACL